MLADIDLALAAEAPFRYDYRLLKEHFIASVRRFSESPSTEHHRLLAQMPIELRKSYKALIDCEWFSFIDIIDLCARYGVRQDSLFIQSHGLIDELCYAEWHRGRMIASNAENWLTEQDVSPVDNREALTTGSPVIHTGERTIILPELQDRILADVECPGLALIGTLRVEDIMELRARAAPLFELRELVHADSTPEDLQRRCVSAVVDYWSAICEHIRSTRPALGTDQTRLAVFVRHHLPTMSSWASSALSFTVDLGLDAAGMLLPGLAVSDRLRARLHGLLSFRFIFYGDSRELRSLRNALPANYWLLRPASSRAE